MIKYLAASLGVCGMFWAVIVSALFLYFDFISPQDNSVVVLFSLISIPFLIFWAAAIARAAYRRDFL
jgi:multisubunit Na+/H+ antiporter MnhG subunit